jgi:esterase/lipase
MDVEKTIEHLLSLQAGHDARIQILEEKHAETQVLVQQLIGLMSALANRQAKDTKQFREDMRQMQAKTDAQIRETQGEIRKTQEEIRKLSAAVRSFVSRNGRKN